MNDAELRGEFKAVRDSIDALTQGLVLLAEGQQTQTELMNMMMEAITTPPPPSRMTETLERIFATLDAQTEALARMAQILGNVNEGVERAVMRGLHRAVGTGNADGEVAEDGQ
jgi:hypothetical protein